jgi:hypothetical protein
LVALALAAACSGGSTPQILPSLSPTPSASATRVAIPAAATVHDAFGAAAFVRFYYEQLNLAFRSADAGPLGKLSDPQCGTCASYVQATFDLKDKGQRIDGDSIAIVSAEAPPEQNGFVAVDVFLFAPARRVVDSSGKVLKQLPQGAQSHKTIFVKHVAAGWLLRAVKDAK